MSPIFDEEPQLPDGRWFLRIDVPIRVDGKTVYRPRRKTMASKEALLAWERSLRAQHRMTGSEGALGVSEVAEYREAKLIAGDADLREVARFWLQHQPKEDIPTVSKALSIYTERMQASLSPSTWNTRKSQIKTLEEYLGIKRIDLVTPEDLEDVLEKLSINQAETSCNNHLRFWKTFFTWATKRGQRWIKISPAEAVDYSSEPDEEVEFIPVADVEALLRQAEQDDPGLLPFLCLALFSGVRTEELKRIEPEAISVADRRIRVGKRVAKRGKRGALPRVIEGIPDCLWHWLEPHVADGVLRLDTVNVVKRRAKLVSAAGIEWKHSYARHSFATYACALYPESTVQKWTGHRNPTTLQDHYKGLAYKSDGLDYFALRPGKASYGERKLSPFRKAVDWPSDAELSELLKTQTRAEVARALGVSWAAVSKRLKSRRLGL